MRRPLLLGLIAAVVIVGGALLGPAALTAAEPTMCTACHVMDQNVNSFHASISKHKEELTCSDCHLPHDSALVEWSSHYGTGLRHLATTVSGKTPDELKLRAEDRQMVIANCVRCHKDEEHIQQNGQSSCLNCHSTNPHGDKGVVAK